MSDPTDALFGLLTGHWGGQTVYAGAKLETEAVLEVLDGDTFADVTHLCDVGGGRGYLLSRLLQEHPHLTGEVLELPRIAEEAGEVPEEMGVADRLTFTAGDMFEGVPEAEEQPMSVVEGRTT